MSFSALLPGAYLGDVPLADFAIPDRIKRPLQQQFTTHKHPGGARTFDRMGPDPDPITFGGLFLGIENVGYADALQTMLDAGEPVTLTWGLEALTVLVSRCDFDYGFNQVGYNLTLIVVPDPGPEEEDDEDLGNGAAPDTPATAQDSKQQAVSRARTTGKALPVPPIPPATAPAAPFGAPGHN